MVDILAVHGMSGMGARHRSVVIVPPESGLESRWDLEMCWSLHVTLKLGSGITPKSESELCNTHVISS